MTNFDTLKYRIAFTLMKGVGCATAKALLAYFETPEQFFATPVGELKKMPGIHSKIIENLADTATLLKRAEKEAAFIEAHGIIPVFITDEQYPFRLKECADAPVMLYVKGNVKSLSDLKMISIVGTRRITEYGKETCHEFVKELAIRYPETVIVSGLAYGADACAHKAALEFGLRTVGVTAHGQDRIYPAAHTNLARQMAESGGAVCTEYITETNPDKQNFVQRNRIVAGLCDATIVIESAEKGGALITADLASSYNRDVLAFPGRKNDEMSAGCNKLRKTNRAAMLETVADLEYVLGWESKADLSKENFSADLFAQISLTADEQRIFELLKSSDSTHVNQLSIKMGLPMSKITPLLIGMEFKGVIKCLPGNMYKAI